jgi:hypothetical protein
MHSSCVAACPALDSPAAFPFPRTQLHEEGCAAVVVASGLKKDTLVKKRLKYADTKK